jgi:hypothetical protein
VFASRSASGGIKQTKVCTDATTSSHTVIKAACEGCSCTRLRFASPQTNNNPEGGGGEAAHKGGLFRQGAGAAAAHRYQGTLVIRLAASASGQR